MGGNKICIVDFFTDLILQRKGKLTGNDIQEIICSFEHAFSDQKYMGAGKKYWGTYSKYIVKKWMRSNEHPDEIKNLLLSLGDGEEDIQSGPPDFGLRIKSKDEKDFTERFVVPYLENEGHTIAECNANRRNEFNIDVVSDKDGTTYYTEVKPDLGNHKLQTAIGQLLLKIFDNQNDGTKSRYQIAFPEQYKGNRHFLNNFEQFLDNTLKIGVVYIKG